MYCCKLADALDFQIRFSTDETYRLPYGAISFEPKRIIIYNIQQGTSDPKQIGEIERILWQMDSIFAERWIHHERA